ncbi:MAG: DUF3306 domain-containing protein [Bradyrhizobium sp.]
MSDPENILSRWARRKSQAHAVIPQPVPANAPAAPRSDPAASPENTPPFDPASLPSIESIDSETDLHGFFGKNVPADLTRAALRRGWSADLAVRDFVGLSENSWDFNDPEAMHGFGTLGPAEVQKMLAQMLNAVENTEGIQPATPSPSGTREVLDDQPMRDNPPLQQGLSGDISGPPRESPEGFSATEDASVSEYRESTEDTGTWDKREMSSQSQDDRPETHPRRHGGALPRIKMD